MSDKVNPARVKKFEFMKKLYEKLSKYNQVALVTLIHVSSSQVQDIRKKLAEKGADLVIGKNTVIKKAIQMRMSPLEEDMEDYAYFRQFGAPKPQLEALYNQMKNKVGLVFSDVPIFELKPLIESNKLETVAKVGAIAPVKVVIPPGPTGLDPSQISFFHALSISTKINKGQIEILKEVQVCEVGKVVGNSEAVLLAKLNIKPFFYGMEVLSVYDDGAILDKSIVGISPADICDKFRVGANNIASLSLHLGIPTEAAIPHMIMNAFKNLAAISFGTDYKLAELENASNAPAQSSNAGGNAKKEEAPKQEEEEEEEDVDMGDIFGGF